MCISSTLFADDLGFYKDSCKEIGFKPGTDKFGDCVLKLRAIDKNKQLEIDREKDASYQRNLREAEIYSSERDAARLREQELQIQRDALEEQKRANVSAERQRAYNALIEYANGQQRNQNDRLRTGQEEMNRLQRRTWEENQRKMENDWKYR